MEEIVIEGREEHDMLRENGEEAIEDSWERERWNRKVINFLAITSVDF
jgi:hypothetical protein